METLFDMLCQQILCCQGDGIYMKFKLFQLWKGTNQWRYRRVFIQRLNNHAKPAVARDLLFRVRILKKTAAI